MAETRMGRPPARIDITEAKRLLQTTTATDAARILGVHRNTLYRHLTATLDFQVKAIKAHYDRLAHNQDHLISQRRISVKDILIDGFEQKIQECEAKKRREIVPSKLGRPPIEIDIYAAAEMLDSKPTKDVAAILKCSRNTLLRRLQLAGLNRTVTGRRSGLSHPHGGYSGRVELYYPYLTTTESDGSDLVIAVNGLVTYGLPAQVRADICQEMILAVLTGEMSLSDLKVQAGNFIKKFFAQFSQKYGFISLDHPAPGDPYGRTLAECIGE